MQFTLKHYQFDVQNGIAPLWNSIAVALATALLGVLLAGAAAIVVNKFRNSFTGALSLLAVLPSAVPGMVLGLGYVLTFNNPMNPLNLPLWRLRADHHPQRLLQPQPGLPHQLHQPGADRRQLRRGLDHARRGGAAHAVEGGRCR